MKNKKAIVAVLCAMFVFASAGYCGKVNFQEGINPNSPMSVGDAIYFNSKFGNSRGLVWLEKVKCDYDGFENNAIKITVITNDSLSGNGDKTQHLALPLNDKKQTLLKVPAGGLYPEKTLLITVVDEFYRIKVEEFRGT